MKHVSRTHKVALDWLFDRINLDPKIQVKHVDTQNQLADILTKGNFARDEWKNLLHLFNLSHFSFSQNFQLDQLHQNDGQKDARTGRREQDRGKVKAMNLAFSVSTSPWDTRSTLSNRLVKYKET